MKRIARIGLLAIPLLVLLLLIAALLRPLADLYEYYFVPPISDAQLSLEKADSWDFRMNSERCGWEEGQDGVTLTITPTIKSQWSMVAGNAPMTIRLAMSEGAATIWRTQSGSVLADVIRVPITDTRQISVTARSIETDFGGLGQASLRSRICAPGLYVGAGFARVDTASPLSDKAGSNRQVALEHPNEIAVRIDSTLAEDSQVITATLRDVQEGSRRLDAMTIVFQRDAQTRRSQFYMEGVGEFSTEMPYGPYRVVSGLVNDLVLRNPVGDLALQYQGVKQLRTTGIWAERRELSIKTAPGAKIVILPVSSTLYSIDSYGWDVRYMDEQLVHTRWQQLSPEIQAAIVTAALTLLGWLLVRFGPTIYPRYAHSVDRLTGGAASQPVRLQPQAGHLVLVLASGRALSGEVKEMPSLLRPHYVLSDSLIREPDGSWMHAPGRETKVDSRQVEYSYVIAADNRGDHL